MGMKQGYKQTEIGVIPEDWSSKKIKTFAKICMCKRVFADQTTEIGEIPFYKIGTFGGKPDAYISKRLFNDYREKYSYPTKGDILISAAGTLGRMVVFDGTDSYFQDSNIVWLDIDKAQICNEYLRYYYEVIKWSAAEGSTISRLYNGIIESTCVAIPPLSEQHRIADALSDVDELIASLEKLIEKKKALKQGVMQELLTGKRRLPGFSGEWKKKELSKIATLFAGGTPNTEVTAYYDGDIPWVSIADISETGKYIDTTSLHISEAGLANSSAKWYPTNTILFAMYASIGKCCITTRPMTSSQAILGIYELKNCLVDFLYYQLLFRQEEFLQLKQTGTQSNLSKTIVGTIKIQLPTIEEQTGIATVLSDIDNEIVAKERELQKYRRLKSGMMSELLTGRIRLM